MPSTSPEQKKTMSAIAHGWKPTGSAANIPVKVAKEFHAADKRQSAVAGGSMSSIPMTKGSPPQTASYATGGSVLGRTRSFLKEEVEFREPDEGERESRDVVGDMSDEDQKYGKGGPGKGRGMVPPPPERMNKSLSPVKPRK